CSPNNAGLDCITGLFIPTAFSPTVNNGPSQNNAYSIIAGKDVLSIEFTIFDRWGNKMFYSNNKVFSWDGNYNGKECGTGIYPYRAVVKYADNPVEQILNGNITLIR
ncbi:MAG: T9SS type B sorting domain-containing protein, partial [Crocinitomicaceae bacterium]